MLLPAWKRIWWGAMALVTCVTLAVVGYHYWGGYDWIEALWIVAITISTVGFGERSEMTAKMQLFTVGVILFGVVSAAYTFAAFMQLAIEGDIERLLGSRRMNRELRDLKGHAIVCGYGRTGAMLSESFGDVGMKHVVIDNDSERVAVARSQGKLVLVGDATEEDVLLHAGIHSAGALLTCLPNDAENVFITLTARNLAPDLLIIARADLASTEKKLRQAGATKVVLPAVSGARLMARMVARPSTAEFVELVSATSFSELELDEVRVRDNSVLVGKDVRSTEAHRKHRLLVVAVTPDQGSMIFNPEADYRFSAGDTFILMGRRDAIERFRNEFQLNVETP